jgi:hypothetical protein
VNVRELIEALGEFDGDVEVRLAYQPTYPLQESVGGLVAGVDAGAPAGGCAECEGSGCDACACGSCEGDGCAECGGSGLAPVAVDEEDQVVFLLSGGSAGRGYASRSLWAEVGW